MRIPRRTALLVAGWSAAGVLAVGTATGVGIAFAGNGQPLAGQELAASPSATPSGTPSPGANPGQNGGKADRPGGRHGFPGGFPGGFPRGGVAGRIGAGLGQNALHGEFVVKDKDGKIVTKVVQHGQITAVSATSVTLKSDDGFTATYVVNGDTKVNVGGSSAAISGVKTGNDGWVIATKSGDTATASNLVVRTK
jgi:hypothetical protein